jgi:hypothetical protein
MSFVRDRTLGGRRLRRFRAGRGDDGRGDSHGEPDGNDRRAGLVAIFGCFVVFVVVLFDALGVVLAIEEF